MPDLERIVEAAVGNRAWTCARSVAGSDSPSDEIRPYIEAELRYAARHAAESGRALGAEETARRCAEIAESLGGQVLGQLTTLTSTVDAHIVGDYLAAAIRRAFGLSGEGE